MKRSFFLIAALIAVSISICKAQTNYQPGYIILNDGTRISGMIRLSKSEPWINQRRIYLKDSAAYAADPGVRSKKYIADDMKLYKVGDVTFDKVHYVNIEKLQLKSLGTNDHMMERLAMGRITAHKFYSYPDDFSIISGNSKEEVDQKEEKMKNDLIIGFKILTQKDGDEKLQDAFDMDLLKYLEDTPDVMQKYQSGGYGNQPITPKKGLAAKMMAMAKKAAFKPQEADAIVAAFNEYNEKNPTKK